MSPGHQEAPASQRREALLLMRGRPATTRQRQKQFYDALRAARHINSEAHAHSQSQFMAFSWEKRLPDAHLFSARAGRNAGRGPAICPSVAGVEDGLPCRL